MRWRGVLLVAVGVLLLARRGGGDMWARPRVFVGTAVPTPTAIVATPTPILIYCRNGHVKVNKLPLPAGKFLCVIDNDCVGLCDAPAGTGDVPSSGGTVCSMGTPLDETVTTTSGQASVQTVGTLPAGAMIERCLARTVATVTTAQGRGYDLGVEGATSLYATNVSGTVDATSVADLSFPDPGPNYTDSTVWVTANGLPAQGNTFASSTGQVEVICFYRRCVIPTLTPVP